MSRHKNLQKYIEEEEDDYDDYDDDYDYDYDDEDAGEISGGKGEGDDLGISFDVKEIRLSDSKGSSSAKPPALKTKNDGSKASISAFGKCISQAKTSNSSTLTQNTKSNNNNNNNNASMCLYEDVSNIKGIMMQDAGPIKKTDSVGSISSVASLKRVDSKTGLKPIDMITRSDSRASTVSVSSDGGGRKRKPFDMNLLKQAKEHLNLVIVGHVDAGKSTLVGHLLVLASEIESKLIQKYERDSQKIGKGSFAYAWVMDENEDERNRGITIEVGVTKLNFPNRIFTLLDSPGHRDFIPNMLSGTAQADVAILVVDAGTGAFESGFQNGGQTKEHALLLRSLGITQVIVAVNKLDLVGWSESRYEEIKNSLGSFLSQIGFKRENVKYVPCAGLSGENLMAKPTGISELQKWYKNGPSLADLMNQFEVPTRPYDKPVRATVSDFFKGSGSNTVAICVRVESGVVQSQDRLILMPIQERLVIKSITKDGESVDWAAAGDIAVLTCTGIDLAQMNMSYVLCSADSPVPVSDKFKAQIVTFDIRIPLICGSSLLLYHASCSEEAVITSIQSCDGKRIRCIPRNTSALVQITLKRKICLEKYQDFKELGRFTLRLEGESIGAGIITEI